jgi:hypothetical protein
MYINEGLKDKNDYSITVYQGTHKRLFQEYVQNIYTYSLWLKKQGIQWDYLLVYVRRTRQILCYYKNGDHLHGYPNFEVRGRIKENW